jgi:two-component system phosphate regulon sensor histidine kinase PhoR
MWPALFTLALAACVAIHVTWRRRMDRARADLQGRESKLRDLEEAHRRAVAQHEAILNSIHQGALLLDVEGRVLATNRALGQLFESNGIAGGKSVIEVVRSHEIQALADRLRTDHQPVLVELDLPGPPLRRFEVAGSAVKDREGRVLGLVIMLHDLTRLKRLEDTRREFVANVSHELRTPLSMIKGYVETLMDGAKEDPVQLPKFLGVIQKHADRLAFLIEDLLTLSRLDSASLAMDLREVDLGVAVGSVLDDLGGRAAERKVVLDNRVPEALGVHADPARLGQILFNLLENAIKYGRSPGHVVIRAVLLPEAKVEVQVQDDGPGIPAESLGRVFERFYRVDRARSREEGGTGLGLAIVKHLVQAQGGVVWVRSEAGRGATFHFTLPIAGQREADPVET